MRGVIAAAGVTLAGGAAAYAGLVTGPARSTSASGAGAGRSDR